MSEEAWVSTHESAPHTHEEYEAPQWVFWVVIAFFAGVMLYFAAEEWLSRRKFERVIEAWSKRAHALLSAKAAAVAQEVTDETPAAGTSEAV